MENVSCKCFRLNPTQAVHGGKAVKTLICMWDFNLRTAEAAETKISGPSWRAGRGVEKSVWFNLDLVIHYLLQS